MATQSTIEAVPVEILNHILAYLVYPRSRLPGLTECLSNWDCPTSERAAAVDAYISNSASPPDTARFAQDLFRWSEVRHPFNVLARTSRRFRKLVERFCAHLVRKNNLLNLPWAQSERDGPHSVYPDLSQLVYRRLWLQCAPRYCVFCSRPLSRFPHRPDVAVILACQNCFYAQTLTIFEVESQFHISRVDLESHKIRTSSNAEWMLRTDIETLALHLYGTRRFHDIPTLEAPRKFCQICFEAGTLGRAAQYMLKDIPPGWRVDPSGWIVEPGPEVHHSSLSRKDGWPRLLQYRFDELHYEQREESLLSFDVSYPTYIGHHLVHERLID